MTSQDPGGTPPPGGAGGPDEDATLTDVRLSELDAGLAAGSPEGLPAGSPGGPQAESPPPAAPPPAAPPPAPSASPAYPAFPEAGAGAGPTPGYPPATSSGMAWAPPPASGAGYGVPGAVGLEYAGAGERFVAWLLDIILIGLVGGAISSVLTMLVGGGLYLSSFSYVPGAAMPDVVFSDELYARILVAGFIGAVIGTLIDLAYFVLQWSSGARATLGMRLLGLQVGNAADGRTLDRAQALRRWFAMGSWLDVVAALPVVGGLVALGQFIWYVALLVTTANDPRRQGLHDRFAGTAVVKPAGRSNSGVVVGCIVIAVLLLVVLPIISIVALIFLGGQVSEILSTVGESV